MSAPAPVPTSVPMANVTATTYDSGLAAADPAASQGSTVTGTRIVRPDDEAATRNLRGCAAGRVADCPDGDRPDCYSSEGAAKCATYTYLGDLPNTPARGNNSVSALNASMRNNAAMGLVYQQATQLSDLTDCSHTDSNGNNIGYCDITVARNDPLSALGMRQGEPVASVMTVNGNVVTPLSQ